MTPLDALEYLKNRITTLSLNHKIGSRDIAKREVKDIVMGIEAHVIPALEKALTERDIYYQALCDIESGKDVRMILERVLT